MDLVAYVADVKAQGKADQINLDDYKVRNIKVDHDKKDITAWIDKAPVCICLVENGRGENKRLKETGAFTDFVSGKFSYDDLLALLDEKVEAAKAVLNA